MNEMSSPEDVKQAELEVARRKAELTLHPKQAGAHEERVARRLGDELKPALIGVAVVVGVALLAGTAFVVARRRHRSGWLAPQQSSKVSAMVQSAGLGLLRLVARHAARAVVQRLNGPSVAVAPDQVEGRPAVIAEYG